MPNGRVPKNISQEYGSPPEYNPNSGALSAEGNLYVPVYFLNPYTEYLAAKNPNHEVVAWKPGSLLKVC